jgi:hypothetical protein
VLREKLKSRKANVNLKKMPVSTRKSASLANEKKSNIINDYSSAVTSQKWSHFGNVALNSVVVYVVNQQ